MSKELDHHKKAWESSVNNTKKQCPIGYHKNGDKKCKCTKNSVIKITLLSDNK